MKFHLEKTQKDRKASKVHIFHVSVNIDVSCQSVVVTGVWIHDNQMGFRLLSNAHMEYFAEF